MPTLPPAVLARRTALPTKPEGVVLLGPTVELRPLELAADVAELFAISTDPRVWTWMSGGPFADPAALRAWLATQVMAADGTPLAVRDRETGALAGVANFLANQPVHLKIELGAIWYGPAAQGTGISAEATHLMLGHAFALGYRRVEWKCDARNEPSWRAAVAYGFTFEGIQQAHYIVKDDNRDTAWFRMLDQEWADRGGKLAAYAAARRASARTRVRTM